MITVEKCVDLELKIKDMVTTEEYFNLSKKELLVKNSDDYTKEECKLLDLGLETIYFKDVAALRAEVDQFTDYINKNEYYVVAILKTIRGRVVVSLN